MTRTSESAANPLRISDLVPLRRMLGTDSLVIRVNPDGSFAPFQRMPALFFDRSIRNALSEAIAERFADACRRAITDAAPTTFRPDPAESDEIMINPILDDAGDDCRFLVCWARHTDVLDSATSRLAWGDLRLDEVTIRYRWRSDNQSVAVEAAPWWVTANGELLELWPHHTHVSAMGLGHAVIQALITDAAEAAAGDGGGPAVRITVPSADMLTGLVPVFHGAVRASGLDPSRVVVAIDVALAVDQDLLPIIVHLRTMGMRIDIVGLDAFTATLHTVSDTSTHSPPRGHIAEVDAGPWCASFAEAVATAT